MSEKSIGAKGKPPDKQEATVDGNAPNSKEKLGNNLNENDSGEKQSELPKISEKPKAFEKKSDSRPSMKINPSSNRNGKSKREDDKRASYPVRSPHSRGRHYEKSDSRTYQSSSFKSETKRSDSTKAFTDDSRLSKYIRRVIRDGDKERRISSAKQLRDYLRTSDGVKMVYKVSEDAWTSLQEVFYERPSLCPKEVKVEVAKCVGIIGGIMGHDSQRYFQWLFSQTNNMVDDEIRSLFIDALYETLRYDEKKQATANLMPMVMANVQTLLENADTPDLLNSVVNVILHIAKNCPSVFTSHFRDTVDILVGWHIDSTQKESLIEFTSSALIEFHRYWVNDISFSTTLLGQFLEDMEAYAEDLAYGCGDQTYPDEEIPNPEDCIIKIGALIKVFTTVVKSMGEEFTPSKHISREYISQILDRITKSVDTATRHYFSEYMVIEANSCIQILIGQLRSEVVHSEEHLLPFVLYQIFTEKLVSYRFISSMLTVCQKVIETFGTQLPVNFVSQLFAPGSMLQRYRFYHSEKIIQQILALYHDVMALKSVPLLEESFKYVVGDLQQAFKTLLQAAGEKSERCVISVNPYCDVVYSVTEAESVCIFNLCALAEIGNTKSNLIAMWALSPSIFDLVSKHFSPLDEVVSEVYPAIQYALLSTLFSHCSRHGNFVSSSSLIMQTSRLDGSPMANVNPTTASNFTQILRLLAGLLAQSRTSYDSRCLGIKWIADIIGSLQTNPQIFCSDEFTNVIRYITQLGHHNDFHISMCVCKCLQDVYKINSNLPIHLIQSALKLSVYKLSDVRPEVRDGYLNLLKALPVNVTTRLYSLLHLGEDNDQSISLHEGAEGVTAAWLARRAHVNRIPNGEFHAVNFRQIMAFILHDTQPIQSGSWNWLEAMFYSCQDASRDNKMMESFRMANFVDNNEAMLWFWATWESAQYCVLNRLRTPLGKPQDTFTSIEGVLKMFAKELDKATEEGNNLSKSEQKKGSKSDDLSSHLRVHLLLQFMEHLEKLLYNAYEGCAMAMPMSPKTVRTFFRTNKGTCLEWLSRIRSSIIKIALHSGMPAMAVRQCHQLLQEMKENNTLQGFEFEQTVLFLVKALCELKQGDAIMGVYSWCKEQTGKKFLWIKALVEKASGKYESAAKELKGVLKVMVSSDSEKIDSPREDLSKMEMIIPKKITGILSKQSPSPQPDSQLQVVKVHFVVTEVFDCYEKLCDWDSVLEWQEAVLQYRQNYSHLQAAFNSDVDLNYIGALSSFEFGDFADIREKLELVPGASLSDINISTQTYSQWSPKEKLDLINKQFIRLTTLCQDPKSTINKSDISKCLSHVESLEESLLRVASLEWPLLSVQRALTHLCTTTVLRKRFDDKKSKMILLPLSQDDRMDADEHDITSYLHLQRLLDIQRQNTATEKKSSLIDQILKIQVSTASLARKQNNYKLAESVLLSQIDTLIKPNMENGKIVPDGLLSALSILQSNSKAVSQLEVLRVEREGAKLLHSMSQHKESIDILSSSIVGYICADLKQEKKDKELLESCSQLCGKSLLMLVKWLQLDYKNLSSVVSLMNQPGEDSLLPGNLQLLMETEARAAQQGMGLVMEDNNISIGESAIVSDTDSLIGRLLHLSTIECPTLSKAWFTLAGWCYKWGRKSVDSASHGSVDLLSEEIEEVKAVLPKGTSAEETGKVLSVLRQIHTLDNSEEDICEQEQGQYEGAETTRRQLLSCCLPLQIASEDCLESLLSIWRGIVHRVYHYYQLSAKAYFTYLQLNGKAKSEESNEDGNVIATLRLLRLLVKHAWELRNVLESGLASTLTTPWKGIIPQLFSRLSHPEVYVRQSISDLLCRVAHDAPHLIVYPAVVGSSTKMDDADTNIKREGLLTHYLTKQLDDDDDDDKSEDEDSEEEDVTNTMLQNCLASIVEALSYNNPLMIQEVKQLVHELRRITLLWDELWLGTLNQQHIDVTRKLQQLEAEVKKVMNNSSLTKDEKLAIIKEKHRTIMKPTLYTLERLQEITSQEVETPHEQWFQENFGKLITMAMDRLRNPTNPNHPNSSWQPFKQLHSSLQQRAQKRSSLILKMDRISPKLQSLKSTVIAMPGLGMSGKVVTIESVSNTVQILPTKTKPKKLILLGSDGKRYPYLFKGLEDLHLDERIMQFLGIVNNMFINANRQEQQLFRARHYSVTPLGPRSGLIQWVDGATPLFSLYKRWQQRDALAQSIKSQSTSSASTTNQATTILRPSEIFYNKLTPALREKGITNLENRKEWPLSVLRSVLQELMVETPGDLLARELWCSSTGPNEWWHITQSYARSTAVMSMIGYIIGLGDRHLDNVLVDLATGEVVHIDYNVCFEKGKGLRVPEKVPFRMTQNIETALGVTGIEGTFRISCEHVMKTLRKGRETLLTLLEAFVYDPLVDWTTGNEGGYAGAFYGGGGLSVMGAGGDNRQTKRDMEREITLSMFSIRMAEMKVPWIKNRDDLLRALPKLQEEVSKWCAAADKHSNAVGNQQNMKEVKQLVKEALNDTDHSLFSLHERYDEYAVVKANRDSVFEVIEKTINEFSHWQKLHKHVIESIQGAAFQKMCSDVATPLSLGTTSFGTVTDFLQGAGQSQIVSQCEQLEAEMVSYLQLQRSHLHRAMDVLHTYATIISQFGTSFADQNRTGYYLMWLQEVLCDFTSERCENIVSQFHELYGKQGFSQTKTQLVLNTEARIQGIITDVNGRLIKLLERRSQENAETEYLEHQIIEQNKTVQAFVRENGMSGVSSLMAWVISALCALNKRYNQMEGAAAGAGDRLMDLTSRDGDWFLDELCSMSSNVMHYIDILKVNTSVQDLEHFNSLYLALTSTHNVYNALQDLNLNFRSIILPEALKAIQAQNDSVCKALQDLENLFSDAGFPIETVVLQLESLHRNAIMGVENDNLEMMTVVKKMQVQYQEILAGPGEGEEMSPGQMLLMGFNGLFTRLEDEFIGLMDSMDSLQVPEVWKKVDAVREGKAMQLSSFTTSTRQYLSSLFFVKRLQAMQTFFHMCTQYAANLQGIEGGNCYDDDQLSRPIKRFIAEYVRKQVIGFPSQVLGYMLCVYIDALGVNVTAEIELKDIGAEYKVPLEDLRKKAVDVCLRNNQFQHMHFTQASTIVSGLDSIWRRHDLARRLDSSLVVMKNCLQRSQLQLSRVQWLHEDLFVNAGRHLNQMVMPNRATVMSEMRKSMQALAAQETGLVNCYSHYVQLEGSIIQRLKWAAGANPSLNLVLQQFDEASTYRKLLYEEERKKATEVVSLCQGILHLEALRTRTSEAAASDANFMSLINKCSETCVMMESTHSSVTDTEILLMNTKNSGENQRIDRKWLEECKADIQVQMDTLRQEADKLQKDVDTAKDAIKDEVTAIKTILTTHHKLMSDIRTILKSMSKLEEQDEADSPVFNGIREYLVVYKNFSENLAMVLKIVLVEDMTKEGMTDADSMIETLMMQVPQIFDDLVNLAPPLISEEEESTENVADSSFASALKKPLESRELSSPVRKPPNKEATTPAQGSPHVSLMAKISSQGGKKLDKVTRDPRTGKAIQERNSYAVSVWRRVKMKLDGRDPDLNKRLSVAEQVEFVIKEANNLDNLSVLYEGWTPWV
ncbi:serine/threonine-protein kinase SMG1-like [Ostrea edulis]|uniref:serine/threonine-protein kinase SMG1-like n=1 Tax=Ostrea edulis TaxID=37623 RepID=UPI0024AF6B80|nr:serine/threonine-protein kinase SMG1-like [Ostrea edulis]